DFQQRTSIRRAGHYCSVSRSNVKIYDKPRIHEASMPNHDPFFLPFDLGNTPFRLFALHGGKSATSATLWPFCPPPSFSLPKLACKQSLVLKWKTAIVNPGSRELETQKN